MATSRGLHVATFLLWLVLGLSIPLLLLTVGTIWRLQTTQRQQQETALVDQARDVSQSLDRTFERVEDGLRALAGSSALGRGDLSAFGQEVRLLSERLGDITVILAETDGSVLLRVEGAGSQAGEGPVRQAVSAVLRAGAPIVSNLLRVDALAEREVTVAVPAFGVGVTAPSRVLIAEIDGARLTRLISVPPRGPKGLVVSLRDRDGVTLPLSPRPERTIGEPASPGFGAETAGRRSGVLPDQGPWGQSPTIRAFSVSPLTGYFVVAALPLDSFGAPLRGELAQVVSIGTGLLIIGLLAAVYSGRRLVNGLRALAQDGSAAVPSGVREVDELAVWLRSVSEAREATERILRESEGRLRDLVGTLDLAAIMVRELSGSIRFWSQGCVRLYGWSREEAVGRSSHELLHTEFPVPLSRIEETLLRHGEWKGDLVHRRRDGSVIIAAAHKALKRDLYGGPHTVMESLVDVTALREAQEALRRLNHDLEQRVRSEVKAREAAQRRADHADRVQALGQLAGGIAHDFNNVLQAVAGSAALIARRPQDSEAVARLVRIISEAATRGASITHRVLLLARRGVLNAEPVEAPGLLAGMREVFAHTLGGEIDIEVKVAADLPLLLVDKAQLETALVNLATNARDAMPDGGTLRLTGDLEVVPGGAPEHPAGLRPGTYVRLSVIDDGAGMTDAILAHVAEPFFTTKDQGKGTGLGLSMVMGFADQSGGGLAIESTVGVGTKVSLWLPSAQGHAQVRVTEAPVADTRRPTGRILVVDDDQLVLDTLTEQLQELGHKVLAASCGTDALAILRAREAVDIMITDLSMPGMNGLTLIKEAHGLRPGLPAILLTGYAGDAAALERGGLARSSYLLMRKPATGAALGARVVALLDNTDGSVPLT